MLIVVCSAIASNYLILVPMVVFGLAVSGNLGWSVLWVNVLVVLVPISLIGIGVRRLGLVSAIASVALFGLTLKLSWGSPSGLRGWAFFIVEETLLPIVNYFVLRSLLKSRDEFSVTTPDQSK